MKNPFETQEGGSHYKKLAIQPMQYALANGLDYGQANVVKYVTRFKDKNGKEDLLKAKHCIDLLLAHYYPDVEEEKLSPCEHAWTGVSSLGDGPLQLFFCVHCGEKRSEEFGVYVGV